MKSMLTAAVCRAAAWAAWATWACKTRERRRRTSAACSDERSPRRETAGGFLHLHLRRFERREHPLAAERWSTQSNAGGIVNRIGDCCNHRLVAAFAGAVGSQIGALWVGVAVDQNNVNGLRRIGMPQGRVRTPVNAGDLLRIELDFLPERPAQCLQHAALDGVVKPQGIDDQAAVVGTHQTFCPDATGLKIDFDFGDHGSNGIAAVGVRDTSSREYVATPAQSFPRRAPIPALPPGGCLH